MRAALGAILLAAGSALAGPAPALQDGDIVFQTSLSSQSVAVQRATGSRWSHMGVIVLRDGRPWVLEAIATVRYTPLPEWIARGAGHHFVAKRLRDADRRLRPRPAGRDGGVAGGDLRVAAAGAGGRAVTAAQRDAADAAAAALRRSRITASMSSSWYTSDAHWRL